MADAALPPSDAVRTAAWTLRVDSVTADVVRAFEQRGVPSILLKGPAIAAALYEGGQTRTYFDADLLVPREALESAGEALRSLGFTRILGEDDHGTTWHAAEWHRTRDHAGVDLHHTLHGAHAPPEVVWRELAAESVPLSLHSGRVCVTALTDAGLACVIALHAMAHGAATPTTSEDLRRAIATFDAPTWQRAARLAEGLGAEAGFAAGLEILPEGRRLREALGVAQSRSVEAILRAGSAPPLAGGIAQLSRTSGTKAKAEFLRRELVPSPAFMRRWSRLARRGRAGLALSYAWRPIWLSIHLVPALRAWRQVARGR